MAESPIEDYLDELTSAMSDRPPRELRGLLAEAEAHLRDDAEAAIARGVPPSRAEHDAVARFGPAAPLAAAERDRGRPPLRRLLADLLPTVVLLAAVGAIAVGVSGLVAEVIRLAGGSNALVDVTPGHPLSAADCARWLAIRPSAPDCRSAAIADWADETVFYRLAVGILGLLLLISHRWLRRSHRLTPAMTVVRDAVGHTAFAVAALGSLVLGIDAAVTGGSAGQWLSATPVALVGAGTFAVLLLRDLRRVELS
ncbi:MAG TPA: permease prefix domain 1-containing protein [Jatrophihabitans sp.]|nr:permease prefix domain 1-containing protein [Jatrophihabitans sp.]